MNQIKSGTLFVVIATIVTAVLILTTNRDDVTKTLAEPVIAEQSKTPVIEAETTVIVEPATATIPENTANNVQTAMNSVSEAVEIKAPEGPFNKAQKDASSIENTESDVATAAVKIASIESVTTSTQHDLLNHILEPIWMDQKLGDFKSVETGEVVFKIMPTSPNGLQGEDPKGVVTSKTDKFAPTTVSDDYNYQQMPMYNGGYYIAPMPPYLMPSVLPQSAVNNDQ